MVETRQGWAVVAGCFCILTVGFGCAYSFGVFFTPLQEEFGASHGAVSTAFAVAILALFSVGPASGSIADRLGPRVLTSGGPILVGIGMVVAGFGQSLWHVQAAFALGVGGGVGLAYVPGVGAVQKWFDRRRGLATGVAVSGIGAGTLLIPPLAATIVAQLGWREAFIIVGAAVAVAGGAAGLLVAPPPRPSDQGAITVTPGVRLGAAVTTRPFALLAIGFLLASFGQFTPIAHLAPYAEDKGISPQTAALLLSLLGVGSAIGRFGIGAAADRIGRWRGLGLSFGGCGLSCILWLVGNDTATLGVFAVLLGTCWGGAVALAPAVMADYFGTRAVSGIIGILYTGVGLGALVGPIMAGVIFDWRGSYTIAILVTIIAPIGAAASVLAAESPSSWRRMAESSGLWNGLSSPERYSSGN